VQTNSGEGKVYYEKCLRKLPGDLPSSLALDPSGDMVVMGVQTSIDTALPFKLSVGGGRAAYYTCEDVGKMLKDDFSNGRLFCREHGLGLKTCPQTCGSDRMHLSPQNRPTNSGTKSPLSPYAHRGLWDTCLTKGYDVLTKTKDLVGTDTLALANFENCDDCRHFGDDATYCLVKVRQAGGACAARSCLQFDKAVQQTCLTVADFDETLPNRCGACKHFESSDLQRYCLFVSDHDCTEDDCDEMNEAPFSGSSDRRLESKILPEIMPKGQPRDMNKHEDKDTPHHMCRQRIWDTKKIMPEKSITAHSCKAAKDLAGGVDSLEGSRIGRLEPVISTGANMCGSLSAAEKIFFIDLDPWFTLKIKQQHDPSFDTMRSLRWGGACPGEVAVNEASCLDDGDGDWLTWNNDQWATQRVFYITNEYAQPQMEKSILDRTTQFERAKGGRAFNVEWTVSEDSSAGDGVGYGTGTGSGFF